MSYNVDQWKTKELENLRIPLAMLRIDHGSGWNLDEQPDESPAASGLIPVTFSIGEGGIIRGFCIGDDLCVTEIKFRGACSGTAIAKIVEPALAKSTGKLVAVRIWESGDYIDRLEVVDGVITESEVEL
jgi:hypothetical protein